MVFESLFIAVYECGFIQSGHSYWCLETKKIAVTSIDLNIFSFNANGSMVKYTEHRLF